MGDIGNYRRLPHNALRNPFGTLVQSEAPKRNNGRLAVVRLPISAGLPPGGRAATLTHLANFGAFFTNVTLSGVWVTSGWPCRAERLGRVWLCTGDTSGLRGSSHQALTLHRRVRFIAWHLKCHEKANTDGVRGIFGTAGRVWGSDLRLDQPENGLVAHLYAGGAYDKYRRAFSRVILSGVWVTFRLAVSCRAVQSGVAQHWMYHKPRGGGFNPPRRG